MTKRQGYLFGVTNPNFSGLATAHFAKVPIDKDFHPSDETVDRVPVEAGYGVRQLIGAFKERGLYPIRVGFGSDPLIEYTLDDYGVLQSFQFAGEGD